MFPALPPSKIGFFLAGCITFLLFMHITAQTCDSYYGNAYTSRMARLFHVSLERNIPTLYSTFALFLSAALLMKIAYVLRTLSRPYFYWVGLSVIFLFLTLDESLLIHERIGSMLKANYNMTEYFYHPWVIPYAVFLLLLVAFYFRFLMTLPKKFALLFTCAGTIYVCGGIGMEIIGSPYIEKYGYDIRYLTYVTVEETLEMAGIALFVYALALYIQNELLGNKVAPTEPANPHCPQRSSREAAGRGGKRPRRR